MMHHIDLSSVLREHIACDLYSNLVTRPTGAAVRGQIERMVSESSGERTVTIIDFSQVSMIDFSCADEIVAKLLLRYSADESRDETYFLFRGVNEDHLDAIDAVLERHGLALVVERDHGLKLMGVLTDEERDVWDLLRSAGRASSTQVAEALDISCEAAEERLSALGRRRLVVRTHDRVEGGGAGVNG
jgi:hypothetical protein